MAIDLQTKKVYNYFDDRDIIHELYGGKCYYRSRTDLSFNGYLDPDPTIPIVLFQGYRSKISHLSEYSKEVIQSTYVFVPADMGLQNSERVVVLITHRNIDVMSIETFVNFLSKGDFSSLYKRNNEGEYEPEESLIVDYDFKYIDYNGVPSKESYSVRHWFTWEFETPFELSEYIFAVHGSPSDAMGYDESEHPVIKKMGVVHANNNEFAITKRNGMVVKFVNPCNSKESKQCRVLSPLQGGRFRT